MSKPFTYEEAVGEPTTFSFEEAVGGSSAFSYEDAVAPTRTVPPPQVQHPVDPSLATALALQDLRSTMAERQRQRTAELMPPQEPEQLLGIKPEEPEPIDPFVHVRTAKVLGEQDPKQADEVLSRMGILDPAGMSDNDLTKLQGELASLKHDSPTVKSMRQRVQAEQAFRVRTADVQNDPGYVAPYGKSFKTPKESERGPIGELLTAGVRGFIGQPLETIGGATQAVSDQLNRLPVGAAASNPLMGMVQLFGKQAGRITERAGRAIQEALPASASVERGGPGQWGNWRWVVARGGEVAGQLASQLAIAIGSSGSSVPAQVGIFAGLGGAQAGGANYIQTRDMLIQQGADPKDAERTASDVGVLTGVISGALDAVPGSRYLMSISPKTASFLSKTALRRMATAGTAEGATESLQEAVADALRWSMANDPNAWEQWRQRYFDAFVLGAGAGTAARGLIETQGGEQLEGLSDQTTPQAPPAAPASPVATPAPQPIQTAPAAQQAAQPVQPKPTTTGLSRDQLATMFQDVPPDVEQVSAPVQGPEPITTPGPTIPYLEQPEPLPTTPTPVVAPQAVAEPQAPVVEPEPASGSFDITSARAKQTIEGMRSRLLSQERISEHSESLLDEDANPDDLLRRFFVKVYPVLNQSDRRRVHSLLNVTVDGGLVDVESGELVRYQDSYGSLEEVARAAIEGMDSMDGLDPSQRHWVAAFDRIAAKNGLPFIPESEGGNLPTLRLVGESDQSVIEPEPQPAQGPVFEFTTARGSTYISHEDGTTTRNKAFRPDEPGEQGEQPRSTKTWYVTKDQANILSEVQAIGGNRRTISETPDGRIGVKYLDGPHTGKFEARTVVRPQSIPNVGLIPVESWGDGYITHFGHPITSVRTTIPQATIEPQPAPQATQQAAAEAAAKSPGLIERLDAMEAKAKADAKKAIDELGKGGVLFSGPVPLPPGSGKLMSAITRIAFAKAAKGTIKATRAIHEALAELNINPKQISKQALAAMRRAVNRLLKGGGVLVNTRRITGADIAAMVKDPDKSVSALGKLAASMRGKGGAGVVIQSSDLRIGDRFKLGDVAFEVIDTSGKSVTLERTETGELQGESVKTTLVIPKGKSVPATIGSAARLLDERVDLALAEGERAAHRKDTAAKIGARARKAAGVTKDKTKVVSEREALKQRFTSEARGARRADRAARKEERAKARERLAALRHTLTQAAKDKVAQKRFIKEQIVQDIKRLLPLRERGKLIEMVAKADTLRQWAKAIGRIQKAVDAVEMRDAVRRFRNVVSFIKRNRARIFPEFRKHLDPILEMIDTGRVSNKTRDALESLAVYLRKHGGDSVPEHVIRRLERLDKIFIGDVKRGNLNDVMLRRIRKLSAFQGRKRAEFQTELDHINELIEAMHHFLRLNETKQRLILSGRARTLKQDEAQVVREINASRPPLRDPKVPGLLRRILYAERNVEIPPDQAKIAGYFGRMAGALWWVTERMSPHLYEVMWRRVAQDGRRMFLRFRQEAQGILEAELKEHGIAPNTKAFEQYREAKVKIPSGKQVVTMTRGEALELYAHSLDVDTRQQMIETGYKVGRKGKGATPNAIDKGQLKALDNLLTDRDKKIARAIHKLYNTKYKDEINAAFRKVRLMEKAMRENYYPRMRAREEIDVSADPASALAAFGQKTIANQGIFKERTRSEAPVEVWDIFDTFEKHTSQVAKAVGYMAPVSDALTLLGTAGVQRAINTRYGDSMLPHLIRRIHQEVMPQPKIGVTERTFNRFMSIWVVGRLSLKMSTVLIQPSSLFMSGAWSSPVNAAKSVGLTPAEIKRIQADAEKYSPMWVDRYSNFVSHISSGVLDQPMYALGRRPLIEKGLAPMTKMDKLISTARWRMAELDVQQSNPELEVGSEAFKEATARRWEMLLIQSDSTSYSMDGSGFTAAGKENVWMRPFTLFSSAASKVYTTTASGIVDLADAKRTHDTKKLVSGLNKLTMVASNYLWVAAIRELMRSVKGTDDDDDRDKAVRLADAALIEGLSTLPFGSYLGEFYREARLGYSFDAGKSPIDDVAGGVWKAGSNLVKGLDQWWEGELNSDGTAKHPAKLWKAVDELVKLSGAFGLPGPAVSDYAKMADNLLIPDSDIEIDKKVRRLVRKLRAATDDDEIMDLQEQLDELLSNAPQER